MRLGKATALVLRVSPGAQRPWSAWAGLWADPLPRGVRAAVPWPPAWEMLACPPGSRLVGPSCQAPPAKEEGPWAHFLRGWEPNS